MAYSCRIFLKEECDGCGMCDEPRHSMSRVSFSDDEYDPFEPDEDYER